MIEWDSFRFLAPDDFEVNEQVLNFGPGTSFRSVDDHSIVFFKTEEEVFYRDFIDAGPVPLWLFSDLDEEFEEVDG